MIIMILTMVFVMKMMRTKQLTMALMTREKDT
jgi:hypothetical protein